MRCSVGSQPAARSIAARACMLLVNKVKTKRTSSPVRLSAAGGREPSRDGVTEGKREKAAAGLGSGEARKAFIPCHQIGRNETKSESS